MRKDTESLYRGRVIAELFSVVEYFLGNSWNIEIVLELE